jgi:hypothetical protein
MPAVNGVGEPCAGEPHARFEVAGAGNGAARSAFCESRVGVLKDATMTTRSGLSRSISSNRASARPYAKRPRCGRTGRVEPDRRLLSLIEVADAGLQRPAHLFGGQK